MAEIQLNIELNGLEGVQDDIRRNQLALMPASVSEATEKAADVFLVAAKDTAPFRSGQLAESLHKQEFGDTGWEVTPDTIYAKTQELGAIHHGNPVMVFQGDIVPLVITPFVYIPPTFFMERAFAEGKEPAIAAFKADMKAKLD